MDLQEIRLWAINTGTEGPAAEPLNAVRSTEAESMLEDLLVRSPDLLMHGVKLIGRQFSTQGGPLDLLGIDPDGRLVVFELKRGTLTRDAVAQVLDYASHLREMSTEALAAHVEERSGYAGIDKIDDFTDWYAENFPEDPPGYEQAPRMVLVGLGADDRTRRMVEFLNDSGLDVQLITFHGFQRDGQLLLARHVDRDRSDPAGDGRGTSRNNKQANLEHLQAQAEKLGATLLLKEASDYLDEHLSQAYRYPGKWGYTYSLQEQTENGRPSLRAYITVALVSEAVGTVNLMFHKRAAEAAGEQFEAVRRQLAGKLTENPRQQIFELRVTRESWSPVCDQLAELIPAIVKGWKAKRDGNGDGVEPSGTASDQRQRP